MKWRFAWILALALLAGPAFALGLGQIQVRSQYGEPLLAEIQIVSSDPAELRQLQARLASPETFARIGLQPPQGLVQDLQFNVALDATGRPVIRVTSTEPVEQPLLTFLIEADWGQGRLVREYSALVDAPDTIAAPAQPPIQAPEVDAGDRIIRPAPAPVAQEPASPPSGPEAAEPAEQPDAQPVADAPGEDAAEPAAPAAPPAPRQAPAVPAEYGPVQAGDTLSAIAQGMAREQGVSVNQMMIALLRTNPEAFIGGNINLLREGAVLRAPDGAEAGQLTAAEATAEVRSHVARWREMSAPRPQPQDTAALAATAVEEEPSAAAEAAESPGSALADARLEIAPASADGERQAGTRSGITAGGEGEMLRQELQETRESLAARDAEVEELRSRLAELEQLQQQQQQLIELKDSELAAVQQRLAESNQQEAPTLAQANQDPAGGQVPQDAGMPWLWIGLALVLVIAAALAWARTRRDRAVVPAARGAAPAAAGASAAASAQRSPTWHAGGGLERVEPQVAPQDRQAPQPASDAAADEPATAPIGEGPRPAAPAFPPEPVETPPSSSVEDQPSAATVPPVELDAVQEEEPAAVGDLLSDAGERLELAKAYAELGDVDTARALLEEVARERDTPESSEAARLLSELA
nr:FimV/HubP family polar landmark protein [Luteimonas sp. JM171]